MSADAPPRDGSSSAVDESTVVLPIAGMDGWDVDGTWHAVPFGAGPGEWPAGDQAVRRAVRRYARSRCLTSGVARWRMHRHGPQVGVYVAFAERDDQINRCRLR